MIAIATLLATRVTLGNLGAHTTAAGPSAIQPSGLYLYNAAAGMAGGAPAAAMAAAAAASESTSMRNFIRTTAHRGFFRFEQLADFTPLVWTPPADNDLACSSHDAGFPGHVCQRLSGLYVPQHLCVLCASIQCWVGGGGAAFGANPHSAANHLISVFGWVAYLNAIPGWCAGRARRGALAIAHVRFLDRPPPPLQGIVTSGGMSVGDLAAFLLYAQAAGGAATQLLLSYTDILRAAGAGR